MHKFSNNQFYQNLHPLKVYIEMYGENMFTKMNQNKFDFQINFLEKSRRISYLDLTI